MLNQKLNEIQNEYEEVRRHFSAKGEEGEVYSRELKKLQDRHREALQSL